MNSVVLVSFYSLAQLASNRTLLTFNFLFIRSQACSPDRGQFSWRIQNQILCWNSKWYLRFSSWFIRTRVTNFQITFQGPWTACYRPGWPGARTDSPRAPVLTAWFSSRRQRYRWLSFVSRTVELSYSQICDPSSVWWWALRAAGFTNYRSTPTCLMADRRVEDFKESIFEFFIIYYFQCWMQ